VTDYCKAYLLGRIRAFPGWSERALLPEADLADDDVVYLCDDHTVVRSPVSADPGLLWSTPSPEWQEFCATTLEFLAPSYQVADVASRDATLRG
jgi:hypothetical protein